MRTCFSPEFLEKNEDVGTSSFLLNTFQDDHHLKIFSEFCYSLELTLSAKTVAFVEITRQTFCSYAVAFFFSKATKFDFCDCFDQRKKTFFLFSSFIFQLKTEIIAAL